MYFRVQYSFPNMESVAVLNIKIAQKSEKNRDDVGWCFQGPVYMSIYGRCGYTKYKNSNKIGKKSEKIVMISDNIG